MKCKIIDDEVYEHRMLYRCHQEMGEYTSEDVQREFFSRTEIAPFVLKHARELKWQKIESYSNLMEMFILTGYLRPQDITFMKLKFDSDYIFN